VSPDVAPHADPSDRQSAALAGRRLLVAVTGGIACYKAASLVSTLVQQGANVRVIMTQAATRFVTPLTFQSLSGQSVLTSVWEADDRPDSQHIGLARWCELFLIAPATAHTMASIAHGLCDNLVTLTACALPRGKDGPLAMVAPSMNADMWANPITQANLAILRDTLGWQILGPASGWQACRSDGEGRMLEPQEIADKVIAALTTHN